MTSRNPGLRPIRRGGHQALDHWLLRVSLVNSYLLSLLGGEGEEVEREVNFRSQKNFREQLIDALLHRGTGGPRVRKRSISKISIDSESLPVKDHRPVRREKRTACVCCKGMRIADRSQKRVTLGQIAAKLQNR